MIKKHISAGATLELRAFVAAEEEKKRGAEIVMNLDQVEDQLVAYVTRLLVLAKLEAPLFSRNAARKFCKNCSPRSAGKAGPRASLS